MDKAPVKYAFIGFGKLLIEALNELNKNDPLRMAGATAFFTTFALPPILIIITQALGLIYDRRMISRQLFKNLSGLVGRDSVHQLVNTFIAIRKLADDPVFVIGGFLFLIFVATTLFKIIKGSINQIWKIRVLERKGVWYGMRNRIQSVILILIAGFLFVIGLLTEGVQAILGKYIYELSPAIAIYFKTALNDVISVGIVTCWFAMVFRFLPDSRADWNIIFTGALFTSLLFNIGKLILHWLLTGSNLNTVYGASGSIVLLLLFVFYCSVILYYGAAFTKIWGFHKGKPIRPLPHAIQYEVVEVDKSN